MSASLECATVWTGAVVGATAGVFTGVFAALFTGEPVAVAYALAGGTGVGIIASLLVAIRPRSHRLPESDSCCRNQTARVR